MARRAQPWYREDRGVWCVTINGKRHNLGANKKEAYDRFHDLMRQPRRQKVLIASVASLMDPFLDWVERNRSAATYEWYRCRLQDFVDKHPQLTIEDLRPHHVEKWAGLPHLAKTSRRNLMRAVKRSLKWAVAQGYIETSPIAHMEVPGGEAREVYVSSEEFAKLLDYVVDPNFADLLSVTYECGCRPQESLRVEARHIDLAKCRWIFPPSEAKTKSMPRVVYLTQSATVITARLANQYPTGPLFRNRRGAAWTKDAIGCAFDRLQVRMGKAVMKARSEKVDERRVAEYAKTLATHRTVRGRIQAKPRAELLGEARRKLTQQATRELAPRHSLYALRHSWATNALKNGIDALTVAILLGHRDPSTLEGAAEPRLTLDHDRDLETVDFRGGTLLTYGLNQWQFKFGYYHLSSHLGDEFAIKHPGSLEERINYVRDSLVLGASWFPEPAWRIYGESAWAFNADGGAQPWEFQFGTELSRPGPSGHFGTPFLALNGHLRQELDFSGDFTAQTGWLWRTVNGQVMRVGLHYLNGKSSQYETFNKFEQQLGVGLWYDF